MKNQDWLSPLRAALAASDRTITAFCRDDDIGWEDSALWPLLDTLGRHQVPLDMAAIPAAMSASLAGQLCARMDQNDQLRLHQHGFRHDNYQTEGRKCEFGDARSTAAKSADIAHGASRLKTFFGDRLDPVFTPPWNRCDQATVDALNAQGFAVLSRDVGAEPLRLQGMAEIGVSVDWCRQRDSTRSALFDLAHQLAGQIQTGATLGLMFHHAVMDSYDLGAVDELLGLLCASGRLRWYGIHALAKTLAQPQSVQPQRAGAGMRT